MKKRLHPGGPSVAIAATLAALFLAGCNKAPETSVEGPRVEGEQLTFPADSAQIRALVTLTATTVNKETLPLSGRLIWDETRTVRVFAPLGGRILKLAVNPGDTVKAGDTLATLSSPDFGEAQAEAAKAGADFGVAARSVERARELHQAGVIADKELEQAEADFARAGAERNRTAARTRAYGSDMSKGNGVDQQFVLRAPIAGMVVERNANAGQEVRPDQAGESALFVISDPSHLWVNLDLPENAIGAVQPGMKVRLRISALDDEIREASVEHVADFIDPNTRRMRARAVIDNADRRLKAEMFANAEITVSRGEFIRVPASTVILLGKTQYVFIEEAPGRFRRQPVVASDAGFGSMRVKEGLKPGDKVVSEGALLLQQIINMKVIK